MAVDGIRKTVLIVESDAFLAEVIACALEDAYDVAWVNNGSGALSALAEREPDATLLDCTLPGGRLTEVISQAGLSGVPLVMMSGDSEILSHFAAFGYPWLRKPFLLDELVEAVDRAMRR